MANMDFIRPEEIYRLFVSNRFIRALKETGYHTYQTGHESGFAVVRDINKGFHITNLVKGESCDQVEIDPHNLPDEVLAKYDLYSETYEFFKNL